MLDLERSRKRPQHGGTNWGRHSSDVMGGHYIRSPITKRPRQHWFRADSPDFSERSANEDSTPISGQSGHADLFLSRPIYPRIARYINLITDKGQASVAERRGRAPACNRKREP